MIKVKDGYAKLINTSYTGDISLVLLSNGGTIGYDVSTNTILATIGSNVASADKLKNKVKIWGLDFDGSSDVAGDLLLGSSKILGKDSASIVNAGDNHLVLGYGYSEKGWSTYVDGNSTYFRYGTTHLVGMFLDSSGKVGIGTISPSCKLDVNGEIHAALNIVTNQRVKILDGQALEWNDTVANGSTSNLLLPRKNLDYRLDYYDGTNWHLLAYKNDIPTKTSQLTNDSGYVTGGPYLPLSGGTMTGKINFSADPSDVIWIGATAESSGAKSFLDFYISDDATDAFRWRTALYKAEGNVSFTMMQLSGSNTGVATLALTGNMTATGTVTANKFTGTLTNTLTFAAGAFSAKTYNNSEAVTVNIPTHTSHLTNNSGFLTLHQSLANYVTLSTDQSITGVKTFALCITIQSGLDTKLVLNNTDTESKYQFISFRQNGTQYGYLGTLGDDVLKWSNNTILHSGNSYIQNGVITINGATITPITSHQSLANYVTLNTDLTITGLKTFQSNSSTTGVSIKLKNKGWTVNMSTAMDFYNGSSYTVPNARIETKMVGNGNAGGTLIFYTQTKHASTNPNPNGLTERLRINDNGLITITGNLTVTGTSDFSAGTVKLDVLNIPTSSGGTTFGPGSNGQVLKSNGTTVYWASDSNSNTWRAIQVNGTQIAGTGTSTYALNFISGTGITVAGTSGSSSAANSITITNAGVRSATINGNYLRVNTNGTNADLTIPYATIATSLKHTTLTSGLDLNTLTTEGVYSNTQTTVCNSLVNGPTGRTNGECRLEVINCGSSSHSLQWLYTKAGKQGEIWYRMGTSNSTWSTWNKIAWASDIPTVTNYYWANVKVSSTSSTTTSPTFGGVTVNGGMKTLAINHNHTLTTPWNDFIACLNPNLTATYHTAHITFGRTYDSKNVGYIGFKYAGSASNSNMVTIGLHSVDNILNILASGNVGIGTTSPSERLHVNGTGRVDNIHLKSTYINLNRNGSNSAIYDSTKTALEIEATTDLSILRTYNVTTQASIVLHKNGNVGIGTLTPSAKLHSHGLVKITANSRTLTIGSQNADHCHYSTDSPCHWFNKEVRVVGHVYGGTNYDRRLAYADELLPLTTITKSIRVTTSWLNTGISGDDLGTGSFVVQIVSISDNTNGGLHWSETYTGLMTSFSGATNDGHTDEIPLHRAGHAPNSSILYLRTAREYNSGRMRLQIAGNYNMSAAQNITFKFRRII